MRVLERDPRNALQIDTVVLGEESAHPRAGRLRVGANTHALAIQLAWGERAAIRVVEDRVMLIPAHSIVAGSSTYGLPYSIRLQKAC